MEVLVQKQNWKLLHSPHMEFYLHHQYLSVYIPESSWTRRNHCLSNLCDAYRWTYMLIEDTHADRTFISVSRTRQSSGKLSPKAQKGNKRQALDNYVERRKGKVN